MASMLKSLLIWFGTIAVFILILYSKTHDTNSLSSIELGLLISDVLVGIVSWAYLVSSFDRFLHKKYSNFKATLLSVPFLLLTLIAGAAIILLFISKFSTNNQQAVTAVKETHYNLINSGLKIGSSGDEVKILQSALSQDKSIYPSGLVSGNFGNLTKEAVINFQKKYSINQSGIMDDETTNKFNEIYGNQTRNYYLNLYPTNIPAPIYINKQVNTTNTDPIIDCVSSHPNCNGSSIKAPQSQCSKIVCCQVVYNGSWSVYPSLEKCDEAQNNSQPKQITVPQNTVKTQGNNTYCWSNAYNYGYYTSSGDQCNLDNLKSSSNKLCNDTQKMKADTCNSACKNTADHDGGICAWAYTGQNAGIEQSTGKYSECLNISTDNYGKCLANCTNQYSQDLKQCN